ncbi:hypothetical protein XNC3_3030005 [Xenorhabdus nematophila F1]|uniref:Uncharacterized protein n=1 Tax=Xenorhabdus koppenhoeferi TaxID=351659 RepID=A0A1I7K341_9GAMM|nr:MULTISPECIES: hypothetical protein [Xenorhabdus]CCW32000.1 hypothetical protein XNC3_3030005 [Xenorhabdus nematophila F1]SFU91800.1 hypothetical protein SAMN05421784_14510 [Xenorhabdus koppenhoeferi]
MTKLFVYQTEVDAYSLARDSCDLIKCAEYLCNQSDIGANVRHLHSCINIIVEKLRKLSKELDIGAVKEIIEPNKSDSDLSK